MKRIISTLAAICAFISVFAQAESSIILDFGSFRAVQRDALTGVNIDPIAKDMSRNACARLKIRFANMSKAEVSALEVKFRSNTDLAKQKVADYYENVLILEMTAKPNTRFYLFHPEYGESNEVTLNLAGDCEYEMEASLNQTYSIVVNSNVEGASIYLDNIYKGKTDSSMSCTISDVVIGNHTLKLVYGSVSSEQSIVVNKSSISFRQAINTAASEPQFVVFVVEPSSAVVTIDNKHYTLQDGAMQAVFDGGAYSYTVSAVGYHSQSGTFTVAGQKVTKNIKLTADSATVTLSVADGAEIWVNGERKGTGSWRGTLVSGTYIFETRKAGYKSCSVSKHITSDAPQQSYTLPAPTPLLGSLVVSGTPIMADVTIDDKVVGQTPIKLDNLLVGEHRVTITKAGYVPKVQNITIVEGKTITLDIALIKPAKGQNLGTITCAPYKVGDYYNDGVKEGVVCEVWDNGNSGKIVSLKQSSEKIQLTADLLEQERFVGMASADGYKNMQRLFWMDDWKTKYPAFAWCAELGEGWYLPSSEELEQLLFDDSVRDAVNNTLALRKATKLYDKSEDKSNEACYLTSTEYYKTYLKRCVVVIDMYNPGFNPTYVGLVTSKGMRAYVRAMATFGEALHPSVKITAPPYKVGDYYNDGVKEGVVFAVDATGRSGKIVGLCFAKGLDWAKEDSIGYEYIGAMNENDGERNTKRVTAFPGWQSKYPAFAWCASLGEGWYIPAENELKEIYKHRELINPKLKCSLLESYSDGSKNYWCSNDEDMWNLNRSDASVVRFSNSNYFCTSKTKSTNPKYITISPWTLPVAKFGSGQQVSSNVKRYKVGDYYDENGMKGVVYYVNDEGTEIKIVNLTQSQNKLQWTSDKGQERKITNAVDVWSGAKNMMAIQQLPKWQQIYPAFAWCASLGKGWCLPAKNEMISLFGNKSVFELVNRTLEKVGGQKISREDVYWSSTDYGKRLSGSKPPKEIYAYKINDGYLSKKCEFVTVRAVASVRIAK